MNIDPHAWLVTLPLAIGMLQACLSRRDHLVRRLWRQAAQREQMGWSRLFGVRTPPPLPRPDELLGGGKRVGIAGAALLLLASLASFGSFLGVLPGV